jgi:hypothetical protein
MAGPAVATYVLVKGVVLVVDWIRGGPSAQAPPNPNAAPSPDSGPVQDTSPVEPPPPDDCEEPGVERIARDKEKAPPSERGRPPIGDDGHPVELHHKDQQDDGPLVEMTRTDHRGRGNFKKNHPNTGQEKSDIDRKKFNKARDDHWKKQWDKGRWDPSGNGGCFGTGAPDKE